jgi:hypothetical protein
VAGHATGKIVVGCGLHSPGGDTPDRFPDGEPTPKFAAMVAEERRRLHEDLGDATLCRILDLRPEGYTREEIAEEIRCYVFGRPVSRHRLAWLGSLTDVRPGSVAR